MADGDACPNASPWPLGLRVLLHAPSWTSATRSSRPAPVHEFQRVRSAWSVQSRTDKGSFASNELPRDFRRRSHFRTHLCARFPLVFSRLHTFARLCPFPSTHTHSRAFACMTQASIIAHRISPFSAPKSAQISPKMRTDLPRPRRAALSLVVPLCAPPASTYRRRTTGRTRPRSPSFS